MAPARPHLYRRNMRLGRATELALIGDAIAKRRTLVIEGPFGSGKSALIDDVAVAARCSGHLVARAVPALSSISGGSLVAALERQSPGFGGRQLGGGHFDNREFDRDALRSDVAKRLGQSGALFIDDAHWADAATIEVALNISRTSPVILTSLSGSSNASNLREWARSAGGEVLRLGRLDEAATADLIRAANPKLREVELDDLVKRSAGNPLLASIAALAHDNPARNVTGHHRALLLAYLARLDTTSRVALEVVRESPTAFDRSDSMIQQLLDAELVMSCDDGLHVVSPLFADPELLDLDSDERTEATAMLTSLPTISAHTRAEWLLRTGDHTAAFRLAISVADGPCNGEVLASSLRIAAMAALATADCGLSVEAASRLALDAAQALNEMGQFAEANDLIGSCDSFGEFEGEASMAALSAAFGSGDHATLLGAIGRSRGLTATLQSTAAQAYTKAVGEFFATAVPLDASLRSTIEPTPGFPEAMRLFIDKATDSLEHNAEHGHPAWPIEDSDLTTRFDAARNLAMAQIGLGHHSEGSALAKQSMDEALAAGNRRWALEFEVISAMSKFQNGDDLDDAFVLMSHARHAPARPDTRALALTSMATILADRGEFERSAAMLLPWLGAGSLDEIGPLACASVQWGAVQRAWLIGDGAAVVAAARWVDDHIAPFIPSVAGIQVMWAWAEYELGAAPTATHPTGGLLDCAALEAEAIGLLRSDPSRAPEGFRSAAASWERILRRSVLRCRWGEGHALALIGETDAATDVLGALDSDLERYGATALRPRVRADLRRVSSTIAAPQRGSVDGVLSAREREVLALVQSGLSSAAIGHRLGVASTTVDSHVRSAMRKLDAPTRLVAAARMGAEDSSK